MKATEQYFPEVIFIMQYKVAFAMSLRWTKTFKISFFPYFAEPTLYFTIKLDPLTCLFCSQSSPRDVLNLARI